ncbi:hypothetical protein LY76DRAFT_591755 [Colletotrichum caudatum]|nr:hypothetical protein LY76DRAFT_591755 [Colletotrichum caudatum]
MTDTSLLTYLGLSRVRTRKTLRRGALGCLGLTYLSIGHTLARCAPCFTISTPSLPLVAPSNSSPVRHVPSGGRKPLLRPTRRNKPPCSTKNPVPNRTSMFPARPCSPRGAAPGSP